MDLQAGVHTRFDVAEVQSRTAQAEEGIVDTLAETRVERAEGEPVVARLVAFVAAHDATATRQPG